MKSLRLKSLAAAVALLAVPIVALADTGPCATNTGGALPDLIVNASKLAQYLSVGDEKFDPKMCAVQEKFVSGPGLHTLLRFTSSTPNIGAGALVVGNPASCPALFEASSCHGHLHLKQYADYRLWTPGGYDTWLALRDLSQPANVGVNAAALAQALKDRSLVVGAKMGFCMIDTDPYSPGANPVPRFTSCLSNQGVSAGWADSYNASLDGQYVQIDGLRTGEYVLEVHVNATHLLPESDYRNNSTAVRVRYTAARGRQPPTIEAL